MKLIVGLGNPGREYERTRHNAGFLAVEELARRRGVAVDQNKFAAKIAKTELDARPVLLVMPQTYMNLSGRSVQEASAFFKIAPADVLVIADDINLALGALRLRETGSAGGHNGLKDIIRALGTQDFPRLRMGVGLFSGRDSSGFVLSPFRPHEWEIMTAEIARAADAAECWLTRGPVEAANRFNGPIPDVRKN
jgi:PTH1 family peptidyl-tRNA hydrolase